MAKDTKETKALPGQDPSQRGTRTDLPAVGSTGDHADGTSDRRAAMFGRASHTGADLNLEQARAEVLRNQEHIQRLENENRQLRSERGQLEQRVAAEQGRQLDAVASVRRNADELNAVMKDERLLRAGEMLKPLLEGEFSSVSGIIVGHGKDERHSLYKLSGGGSGAALKFEHVTAPRTTSWSETREELERLVDTHLTPADRR